MTKMSTQDRRARRARRHRTRDRPGHRRSGRGEDRPHAAGYAPAATAPIHPGMMMYTDGAQCTANFVYTDAAGNTYVGYAAHCAGLGAATDTNGCLTTRSRSAPRWTFTKGGSLVDEGTSVGTGTLAYSSWLTEHAARHDGCQHLRLQRPGAGQGRRRRRLQGQPVGSLLGRPDRHRHRRHRGR